MRENEKAQCVLSADRDYEEMDEYLVSHQFRKPLLVCGGSVSRIPLGSHLSLADKTLGMYPNLFSDFQPNPLYDSVVKGVKLFQEETCDSIIAVGGGSAIDAAKCIRLYARMNPGKLLFAQDIIQNGIPFLAVPTTVWTGSEAIHFTVIYYQGEKKSITHEKCRPDAIILDAAALESLPMYQRKATMLDAFCHALESYWSVNSTEESRRFSREALQLILRNMDQYLENDRIANKNMLDAAYIAGKAIDIAKTTAGHAMCYKLTGLYGIAHGHAAAMCVAALWPYMLEHLELSKDPRGRKYLERNFEDIALAMNCNGSLEASSRFREILTKLKMPHPEHIRKSDYKILRESVNAGRLKNNPVSLDNTALDVLYH